MAIAHQHNSATLHLSNSPLTTPYSLTPTTTPGTSTVSLRASQDKLTDFQFRTAVTRFESEAATRKAPEAKAPEQSIKRALPPLSKGQDGAKNQPGRDGAKKYQPRGAALPHLQSDNDRARTVILDRKLKDSVSTSREQRARADSVLHEAYLESQASPPGSEGLLASGSSELPTSCGPRSFPPLTLSRYQDRN
jgi:hypothetical protein